MNSALASMPLPASAASVALYHSGTLSTPALVRIWRGKGSDRAGSVAFGCFAISAESCPKPVQALQPAQRSACASGCAPAGACKRSPKLAALLCLLKSKQQPFYLARQLRPQPHGAGLCLQ